MKVIDLDNLIKVFQTTENFKTPSKQKAFEFLVSEVGELADCLTRVDESGYTRNVQEKEFDIGHELADIILMCCAVANAHDISLMDALYSKIEILMDRWGPVRQPTPE